MRGTHINGSHTCWSYQTLSNDEKSGRSLSSLALFFRQLKEHLKELCEKRKFERKQMNPKKCDGVQCPKTVGRMDVYGRTDSTMQKEEHV